MKIFFLLSLLMFGVFYSQDRLSFVKDEGVKKEIQNSITFLNKTKMLSEKVKNKVIFISFDIEKLFESEALGFSYTSSIPLSWANLNKQGQFIFHKDPYNNWMFYNYSPQIVLVFRGSLDYFDIDEMKHLSNMVHIKENNIIKSEYFAFNKGNEFTEHYPLNNISMDRKNDKFIPVQVNTFDLKTFLDVWYNIEVKEIPVAQKK